MPIVGNSPVKTVQPPDNGTASNAQETEVGHQQAAGLARSQPNLVTALQTPAAQGGYLLAAPPRGFDTTGDDLIESWRKFKTDFEIYETISDLSSRPENYQRAVLLMCLGETARTWMETVQIDYQRITMKNIISEIELKCTATVTQALRDYKFFSRDLDQKKSETFDVYYERVRAKSRLCKFGDLNDRLVQSRLIIGLRDKTLQKILLAKDLSLSEVVAKCRSFEIGEQNALEINKAQRSTETIATNVAAVGRQGCTACGYVHANGSCSARSRFCSRCGKRGHYARLCRTPQDKAQPSRVESRKPFRPADRQRHHQPATNKVWSLQQASDDEDFRLCQVKAFANEQPKKKWDEVVKVNGQLVPCK
ncbi:uncharacterized protein LOC114828596 [Galendromus occidentalis]|uniref:Uncharacterized protein LOC114828596 n=1 Tax=Galendromus occidentalis TaxID=34638 RepID=A0AAJ7WKB4_9ACAR|nr:uncharacterized protein LOC114828596 [Galendromus occidentalis]